MKCNSDFGGITYTTGDFHTPGTSGLGDLDMNMVSNDFGRPGLRKRVSTSRPSKTLVAKPVSRPTVSAPLMKVVSPAPRKYTSMPTVKAMVNSRRNTGLRGMGSMGFSLNDIFNAAFGKDSEVVKSTLQSGAATALTNVVGQNLAQDPNAKAGIVNTVKESAAAIYEEYKTPILIGSAFVGLLTVTGLYNMYRRSK